MILHIQNFFTNKSDIGKYPITTVHVALAYGNIMRSMKFEAKNTELVLTLLKSVGASRQANDITIWDEDGSVNNIVNALLILKTKKMISPELLNQICDGFPDYKISMEPDHRIREGVENREVADIRKTARWLALLKTDPNQPISQLPDELCTMIAALSGDRDFLDEASTHRIAREFFKRPEKKDNARAVGKPSFLSEMKALSLSEMKVLSLTELFNLTRDTRRGPEEPEQAPTKNHFPC